MRIMSTVSHDICDIIPYFVLLTIVTTRCLLQSLALSIDCVLYCAADVPHGPGMWQHIRHEAQ